MFEDGIEGPILSGSHLKINAGEKSMSWISIVSHPQWYGARPSTDAIPSKTAVELQWFTPQVPVHPLSCSSAFTVSERVHFWSTFTSCFLLWLTVCCVSLWQVRRGTTGPACRWRSSQASSILTKTSNYGSFKVKKIMAEK